MDLIIDSKMENSFKNGKFIQKCKYKFSYFDLFTKILLDFKFSNFKNFFVFLYRTIFIAQILINLDLIVCEKNLI